jgi:diaminohydroxyphosphoribosylaminopyrimidine deaminase/5-amino-6-(5-phosphoribosylamino)uracil reductase
MRRAIALARRGWGQTAPNPMVGAVVVHDHTVVGEGFHARFGERHAEIAALEAAGPHARGATVYVSLEPCAHHGKTPPCANALIAAGVERVVIGARDPNPKAAGGAEVLRKAGIEVVTGVEERRALEADPAFFFSFGAERPWITLKLAVTIDGAIADAAGRSQWITGRRARAAVHELRAGHDAIAVGVGTVLSDNPMLTVRDAPAPRIAPRRVVFDRRARTPIGSALVRTAREVPVIVVTEKPPARAVRALEGAGVRVDRTSSLYNELEHLKSEGIRSIFVEGGARLAGALWERSLVDRLIIFQGPVVLGGGAQGAFSFAPETPIGQAARLAVLERRAFGDDSMIAYAVHHVPAPRPGPNGSNG